ncbi:MAG: hypothetical protein ACE5KM_00475 [Planctomycetaceae bacterium]
MKRILLAGTALIALFSSVGCCYHPGYVNPYTGTPYGGYWEQTCGGPCDPLGWGCAWRGFWGCWGGYGNAYGYANQYRPGYGGYGSSGNPCCDTGCADGCATEPMMVPQTFQSGPQPSGGMKPPVPVPSPDPNMSMQQGMSGSTTYVTPRPIPSGNQPIRQATNPPAVSAF